MRNYRPLSASCLVFSDRSSWEFRGIMFCAVTSCPAMIVGHPWEMSFILRVGEGIELTESGFEQLAATGRSRSDRDALLHAFLNTDIRKVGAPARDIDSSLGM